MISVLLVALLWLGFSHKSAESCNSVINEVKGLCNFYQYTTIDALEQRHALQIITHFGSLFSSRCSSFSRILVCSRFVPFCFSPHHFLQPCHQLCQDVKSSCIHLFKKLQTPWPAALNCSTLPTSPNLCLSPSSQTTPVSLLPSTTSSIDLPSVFSPPSPHRRSSFSGSINPTASSMHVTSKSVSSSSVPATPLPSTVHLHSKPTAKLQSTSQGLILGISLLFAVFILLLPLVLYSLSRHFCPQYQPPTRNQDTIIHIPVQQFTAPEPTPSLPSPPPPPLPTKNKDIHVYENTKGTTLYAVSDLL